MPGSCSFVGMFVKTSQVTGTLLVGECTGVYFLVARSIVL